MSTEKKIAKAYENNVGFHIKYLIKRRYRTKEACMQSLGISENTLTNIFKGQLDNVPFPQVMKLCDALDINPFDFLPESAPYLNRYKYNKIMSLYTSLNSYGRRRILEQISDYLQLEKYTSRNTPLNDQIDPDDQIIEPMPLDSLHPDLIPVDDKLSQVDLKQFENLIENSIEAVTTKKDFNIPKTKIGSRSRKTKKKNELEAQQRLQVYNNYIQQQELNPNDKP